MAIKGFKQVVEKKGYRLDDKDRKIFEKEIKRGYFGFDVGDIIEFVIYDASDNQLPQESVDGKKVRYISYTDENIKKYFDKVPENKFNKKSNNAQEYFIDTEKLLKEAGYSNGVFKTQITLLNRRLGSEPRLFDKVWIHEISPSRTEVRVLPVVEDGTSIPNSDLQARYDTFVNCGTFTADVLIFFDEFVTQFDVATVVKNMLMKKGRISDGKDYIKLIEQEFKLVNFEVYLTQTKKLFQEIIDNYRMNRYYNPFESNFGQPTGDTFGVEFDIAKVFDEVCEMASNAAEYSLPKQDIRINTARNLAQSKTIDKLKDILLTVNSNESYTSTRPASVGAQIRGCMDSKAKNYNPKATIASQCVYDIKVAKYRDVKVCNDKKAENYQKDGDCAYVKRCWEVGNRFYGKKGDCYRTPKKTKVTSTSTSTSTGSSGAAPSRKTLINISSSASKTGKTSQTLTIPSGGKGGRFYVNVSGMFDGYSWSISGNPSWLNADSTGESRVNSSASRDVGYNIGANDTGATRSATITARTKYGTASLRIVQPAEAKILPPPPQDDPTPPALPTKKPFRTNGPQTINFSWTGAVSGPDTIRITTTDTWSFNVTGVPGIYYRPNSSSGKGNAMIMFEGCIRNSQNNPNRGVLTIKSGDGVESRHYLYQESAPKSTGYGRSSVSDGINDGTGVGGKFGV